MSTDSGYTSSLQVERRSIDYIPPEERHGKPRSLFNIWFASNMQVTAAVTGALAVIIGLSLPLSLIHISWSATPLRISPSETIRP